MKLETCDNCGKKVSWENSITLSSRSSSGNSCVTLLCMKCKNNNTIFKKMQHINDLKLDVMDGDISVQEFNKKIRALHKGC
ncbi:unnamed protein product [marine sediment metagenome]|uniref:Uncharacterized protein n=1 Tax=marine sediment metagenome TaxID=412755 RepID=X1Q0P4_9ZZZZ